MSSSKLGLLGLVLFTCASAIAQDRLLDGSSGFVSNGLDAPFISALDLSQPSHIEPAIGPLTQVTAPTEVSAFSVVGPFTHEGSHLGTATLSDPTPASDDRGAAEQSFVLPETPEPQTAGRPLPEPIPASNDQAQVSGTVLDPSGAFVDGAEVRLTNTSTSQERVSHTVADGQFAFAMLPAGTYVLRIRARGFGPYTSTAIALTPQQTLELQKIVLAIAATATEVTVRPTEEIAAEQIRAEEKQRVLGVFPSFFTSYVYDAAPLTAKQKFSLTARDTFDPVSLFFGVVVRAATEQATKTFPGYGNDAPGFGKRVGAALGDSLTSDFLGHAVFPALLHQDPRYFYQGSGSKKDRFYHAVSFAALTRNDSGHLVPNLSYILGDLSSGALSNLYYPHADRGAGLVFINTAIGIGGRAASALFREFVSKGITTNVPGNGKP